MNNPSIRRIRADIKELANHPSDQYAANPLEEDMFQWHFAIRGPKGTDFEGGVYHGRIILPNDYPFKPPAIMLLTPNGRWRVREKICLSISNYHPEQWQPAWGIRTILEALISFMNTPAEGAVGAVDMSPEVRKQLAAESRNYTHPDMPKIPDEIEKTEEDKAADAANDEKYKSQISQLHEFSLGKEEDTRPFEKTEQQSTPSQAELAEETNAPVLESEPSPSEQIEIETPAAAPIERTRVRVERRRVNDPLDSALEQLSIALMMALFAILYRKALQLYS